LSETGKRGPINGTGYDPTSQTVQNAVREVGINANYWYPVGWANQLKPGDIPVTIWQQTIDCCLPRHQWSDTCPMSVPIKESHCIGKVQGCHRLWLSWLEFNGQGIALISIPIFLKNKSFPPLSAVIQSRKSYLDFPWHPA